MRHWLTVFAATALLLTGAARADGEFGPSAGPPGAQSFKVGELTVVALHDAQVVLPNDAKTFGVDVGPAAVAASLKAAALPEDRITISLSALLVRTGGRVVLLDTGLGAKSNGGILASLKVAGVAPEAVTDILITHAHYDHVGGLTDASGALVFPKATVRLSAAEWAAMRADSAAAALVKALDGHVETFTPGATVVPGITAVALDGHTAGHVGYEIRSGSARLLDIGDLAHSSLLSLQHPEWTMGFDKDSPLAKRTRAATLARLAKDQELVFAPHFPFPAVGRIAAAGTGYVWQPATP